MARLSLRKPLLGAAAVALAFSLAACGSSDEGDNNDASSSPKASETESGTESGASFTVTKTQDLDPAGEVVTVTGEGYSPDIMLYLVVCDPAVANGGACNMGEFAQPTVAADGTFTAEITPKPTFGITDCMETPCAIMTSRVGAGKDRTQEAYVPINFAGGTTEKATYTPPAS